MQSWKRKFLVLWSGQGGSIFTSSIIQMAIVWYLTDRTGSAAVLTTATLIGYTPQVVLGPLIGVWIDRCSRKKVMIYSDLAIAAVSLTIVLAGRNGTVPIWLIMVVLFCRSIGAAFHNPSLQAITPLIVPKEELVKYAGYSQGIESVSELLSPAVAGMLYGFFSLNQIIWLDIIGAVWAVATLTFIKIPAVNRTETAEQGLLQEAKAGMAVIRRDRGLMSLILISTLYAVIYFPIGSLFPLLCIRYFQGGYMSAGIVETAFSVGMLAGALALGIVGNRIHKMSAVVSSIALYGVGLIVTGLLPPSGLKIFMVTSFIMGLSIPFYYGLKTAIIQSRIQEQYLGRVFSLVSSIQTMAMPFSLILAGSFAEQIGVNKWFLVSGIATLMLALFGKMLPALRNDTKECFSVQ